MKPVVPEADLIFAALLAVTILVIVVLLRGRGRAAFVTSEQQLRSRGYAVSHTRQRHRGPVTWVWGRYREPIPLHLHFSNRDPVAALAGRMGIADIALGRHDFDAKFFLRSSKPDWAKQFMTEELCRRLEPMKGIQFITAPIANLLSPEYWPDEKNRHLRDLWMLRIDGRLEGPSRGQYVDLALHLSAQVQSFCATRACEPGDVLASRLEGS